ncbi:MAG: DEAD/DEAH box helicase [Desulfonatronovibrionaceae bacterium]
MAKKKNKPDLKQVCQNYQELSVEDKRVIRTLSVASFFIPLEALRRMLSALKPGGKKLAAKTDRKQVNRLESLGIVQSRREKIKCPEPFREVPARQLAARGEYWDVLILLEEALPWSYFVFTHNDPDFSPEVTDMRNALYTENYQGLLKLLDRKKFPWILNYSQSSKNFSDLCLDPWDQEWLKRVPDNIVYQALGFHLTLHAQRLSLDPFVMDQSASLFPGMQAPGLEPVTTLAEIYLLLGRTEELSSLAQQFAGYGVLPFMAALTLVQGELNPALDKFDLALKNIKKLTRKRKIFLPGLSGVLHSLALLARGGPDDYSFIRKNSEYMNRQKLYDPFYVSQEVLAHTVEVLTGQLSIDKSELFAGKLDASTWPYPCFFQLLSLYWLGRNPGQQRMKSMVACVKKAHRAGYAFFAVQAARLLDRLGEKGPLKALPEKYLQNFPFALADLIQPKQSWELTLDSLKNLVSAGSGASTAPGENSRRLAWRLVPVGPTYRLEPREQKMTKSGNWSKGREVSLYRLIFDQEDFDYLSEHDRRVCAAMASGMHNYHAHTLVDSYSINQSLLAAAGHPLVFWEHDLTHPVDVQLREPVLQVLEESQGIRLCLNPFPDMNNPLSVFKEGSHTLVLIHFSEAHLKAATLLGAKGLKVPEKAKQKVVESVEQVASLLTVHSSIGGASAGQAEKTRADPRPVLRLQPMGQGLKVEMFLRPIPGSNLLIRPGQGGKTLFAQVNGQQYCAVRSLEDEQQAVQAVFHKCPFLDPDADWSWLVEDQETCLETLVQLQDMGDEIILEWPEGKPFKVTSPAGTNRMNLKVKTRRDWFSLEGSLELDDGQVLEMDRLLKMLQQSPGRFVQLDQENFLTLTADLRKRLEAISQYGDKGRFHRLAAPAVNDALSGMQVKDSGPWQKLLQNMEQAMEIQPKPPSSLRAELRPYQVEGFEWLARLAHWGAGACLADDMGLGKTVQALALILSRARQGPCLILAPTSVCANWLEEAARFAPSLRAMQFGPGNRGEMLDQAGPMELIVCSYGLLQTEAEALARVSWNVIVADEAQAIKNYFTKRSRAAMSLEAGFRMITTGTPIENHLGELWNLFNFINPGLLGSLERFNRNFAAPIQNNTHPEAGRRLKKLIRPFILRRLKSEVISELPEKTEIDVKIDMSPEETALYEAIRRQALENVSSAEDKPGQTRIRMLAEIMRLRRACCHPELVMPDSGLSGSKLEALDEILKELLENSHQALIFSQFVDHLSVVRKHLDQKKITYQYLDGSTPPRARQKAINAFQAGEGDLFLISLKAGGFGLNLTAADYVIHLDPWWNPAVEDQASDRAHRIGQKRPVTIYRLISRNTIEEKILKLHQHKRDLAGDLLAGTDAGTKLSLDDLMELIREQAE